MLIHDCRIQHSPNSRLRMATPPPWLPIPTTLAASASMWRRVGHNTSVVASRADAVVEALTIRASSVVTTKVVVATSHREAAVTHPRREEEVGVLKLSSSQLDCPTLPKKPTGADEFASNECQQVHYLLRKCFSSKQGWEGKKRAMLSHSVAFSFSSSVLLQQHLLAGVFLLGCVGLLLACVGSGFAEYAVFI